MTSYLHVLVFPWDFLAKLHVYRSIYTICKETSAIEFLTIPTESTVFDALLEYYIKMQITLESKSKVLALRVFIRLQFVGNGGDDYRCLVN